MNAKKTGGDDTYFIVEKILDKRVIQGKTEYLIKWQGYSDAENSWEPYENLKHLNQLIQEFEKKYESNQKQSNPSSNENVNVPSIEVTTRIKEERSY